MADDPKDFRDPKVTNASNTTATKDGGGIGKWLPYIIGGLIALLLLAWLLGLFGADEDVDAVVVPEDDAVVTEEAPATD